MTADGTVIDQARPGVDLYWLPLGAGGHFVRLNGRAFEAIVARLERRTTKDLYHSALAVRVPGGEFTIEMAWPIPRGDGSMRGVVAEGSVGSRWAGSLGTFRYEIRRWCDGVIPDVGEAVESPQRLTDDPLIAQRVLDLVPAVPTPVWGRDELQAGEMWNSNSLISWLIAQSGLDVEAIRPPAGGRAPGWSAGLVVARRQGRNIRGKHVRGSEVPLTTRPLAPSRVDPSYPRRRAMKALVYHGPGRKAWETVPDPVIQEPTDVIVRVDSSTICGTDLHILKGDVPEVKPGTILGHEAVGTITEIGSAVTTLAVGDRVLVSCISSCGRCSYCREGHYGQCTGGGGWIFGHLIDGLQAEFARVPFAETSVYKVPPELSDEQVLFLADILPTAYEVGVLNGNVEPGDTIAVVGAGPIGLATIMTARLRTPAKIIAIDIADARLARALDFGADVAINNGVEDPIARVLELTGGRGVDAAIEAVGIPETFELCTELIRAGGRVANVGVHGCSATLHLEKLWIRNVVVTTGLVDTFTTPRLLQLIEGGRLDPTLFATHRFQLEETMEAYDVFADAASTNALKVVLSALPVAALEPMGETPEVVQV